MIQTLASCFNGFLDHVLHSPVNTGNFSFKLKNPKRIELHSTETTVQCAHYPSVGFRRLLPLLTERLSHLPKKINKNNLNLGSLCKTPKLESNEQQITQEEFWPLWAKDFFQKNDVILGEAGTSLFGLFGIRFPDGALFLSQILWGSIGKLRMNDPANFLLCARRQRSE